MDIRLFDNYEEDGQLSLFGFDEMEAEMPDGAAAWDDAGTDGAAAWDDAGTDGAAREDGGTAAQNGEAAPGAAAQKASAGARQRVEESAAGVRIQRCSSCGKLLYVREEADGYTAVCNNCDIRYFQKVRAI